MSPRRTSKPAKRVPRALPPDSRPWLAWVCIQAGLHDEDRILLALNLACDLSAIVNGIRYPVP